MPNPGTPTLVSPVGGATVTTLTPVLQGTSGSVSGPDLTFLDVEIDVRRNSDSAVMWASGWLNEGGSLSWSKTYAGAVLADDTTYKWRARLRHGDGTVGSYSAYETFTTSVNQAPTAVPSSPAAGASVGTLTPTLIFSFSDPDAGDEFAAYQVQVRRVSDQVSFWDTGLDPTTEAEQAANQVFLTYAGTALVNNTAYEWRVRVQDGDGLNSAYSAWRTFTPQLQPEAPTINSPEAYPGAITDTLTPTISGSYNQGSGASEAAFQYRIWQGITIIYSSGDVATAIFTGQAYGTNNPSDSPSTPPALAWGTTYYVQMRSKDANGAYSEWTDEQPFRMNSAPLSPTNVTPAQNAVVSDQTPTITWTHREPSTDDDAQTGAKVELYDVTAAAYVTGYDPKTLAQSTGLHTVTETLTVGHQYQLRVRTQGLAGPGYGPYSAPVTWTVATAPTITVTTPAVDEVRSSSSMTVEWTFSGGSGTQGNYRVRIYDDDGSTVLYDSGTLAGTAIAHTIEAGVIQNGGAYYAEVTADDTLDQSGSSGLIPFTASFTPPASVADLTATAVGGSVA